MRQAYDDADKNMNNVLSEEEFVLFVTALMDDGEARGNYEDRRIESIKEQYRLANRINMHREGVSMQDWNVLCLALVGKT